MHKGIYTVISNVCIADRTWKMVLQGDTSALERAGQFVDIAIDGCFLRRPFAALEWDSETLSVIYKVVGEGTKTLSHVTAGASLDLLTGLGNGFDASACRSAALIVCGGIGASPVFSLARALMEAGKKVTVIMGFNKADEVILYNEYKALGVDVRLVTMDGSAGMKGLVTDALAVVGPEYDYFYSCGPKVMMKAVCAAAVTSGEVSLEERMGCGCGICYGCTCHTVDGPRRICADGPVFKKEEVIW